MTGAVLKTPRYTDGVYAFYNDDMTPNHLISVVGWGMDNGTEYWCAIGRQPAL
jgi:cathepsin X